MNKRQFTVVLLIIIYLAFISLGLPDTVLGIAWPYMRVTFKKPLEFAGYLTIFGTVCTALSSLMSSRVLARFGTGKVTFVSCLMTATGLLGYSFAPSFIWLFFFLPFLGFGAGAIDCGLNLYVANNYSSRHMNWLHCAWGIGATIGPMLMTAVIAGGQVWRLGYRAIGGIQLALAAVLFLSLGLWETVRRSHVQAEESGKNPQDSVDIPRRNEAVILTPEESGRNEARRKRAMATQIGIFMMYASCEYMVGLWAFSLLTRGRQIPATSAGLWVSFFYAALTGGRFLTGFIVDRIGNRRMITIGLTTAVAGGAILALAPLVSGLGEAASCLGLAVMGLGFSPIYPCMTHETPNRFLPTTAAKIVGYQSGAANLGAAIFPAAIGYVGAHTTLEILPTTELLLIIAMAAFVASLNRQTSKELL